MPLGSLAAVVGPKVIALIAAGSVGTAGVGYVAFPRAPTVTIEGVDADGRVHVKCYNGNFMSCTVNKVQSLLGLAESRQPDVMGAGGAEGFSLPARSEVDLYVPTTVVPTVDMAEQCATSTHYLATLKIDLSMPLLRNTGRSGEYTFTQLVECPEIITSGVWKEKWLAAEGIIPAALGVTGGPAACAFQGEEEDDDSFYKRDEEVPSAAEDSVLSESFSDSEEVSEEAAGALALLDRVSAMVATIQRGAGDMVAAIQNAVQLLLDGGLEYGIPKFVTSSLLAVLGMSMLSLLFMGATGVNPLAGGDGLSSEVALVLERFTESIDQGMCFEQSFQVATSGLLMIADGAVNMTQSGLRMLTSNVTNLTSSGSSLVNSSMAAMLRVLDASKVSEAADLVNSTIVVPVMEKLLAGRIDPMTGSGYVFDAGQIGNLAASLSDTFVCPLIEAIAKSADSISQITPLGLIKGMCAMTTVGNMTMLMPIGMCIYGFMQGNPDFVFNATAFC